MCSFYFRLLSCLFLFCLFSRTHSRKFDQCEFAEMLKNNYSIPQNEIPLWVCIAENQSHFNTAAYSRIKRKYGIFQISEKCWCNTKKIAGKNCNALCSRFIDDDIEDDIKCLKKIQQESLKSECGIRSWKKYNKNCKNLNNYENYCPNKVKDCKY